MIPFSAAFMLPFAALMSLSRTFSTSSPTYPASVKVVASAIANGTFNFCARVFARSVFPLPVGPIKSMFDFSMNTSFCQIF